MKAKLLSNVSAGVNVGKQRGEQTRRQDFEKMKLEQREEEKPGTRHHAERGQQVSLDGEGGLRARLWSKSSLASCSLEPASVVFSRRSLSRGSVSQCSGTERPWQAALFAPTAGS